MSAEFFKLNERKLDALIKATMKHGSAITFLLTQRKVCVNMQLTR